MNEAKYNHLKAAVKKVFSIRDLVYQYGSWVGGSIVIWGLTPYAMQWIQAKGVTDPEFLIWIRLNLLSLPFFFLLLLLIKTAWVYRSEIDNFFSNLKPSFLRKWEEDTIRKHLNSEE